MEGRGVSGEYRIRSSREGVRDSIQSRAGSKHLANQPVHAMHSVQVGSSSYPCCSLAIAIRSNIFLWLNYDPVDLSPGVTCNGSSRPA